MLIWRNKYICICMCEWMAICELGERVFGLPITLSYAHKDYISRLNLPYLTQGWFKNENTCHENLSFKLENFTLKFCVQVKIPVNRTNLFIVDEISDLHFHIIIILLKILLTTPDKVIRSGIGGGNDRERKPKWKNNCCSIAIQQIIIPNQYQVALHKSKSNNKGDDRKGETEKTIVI